MISDQNTSRRQRLQRGQSLVETALGFIFVLVILLGLLDLGRLYFTYIALEDSAGEAALYLALNANCLDSSSGAECQDPNNAIYRASQAASQHFDWSKATITADLPPEGIGVGGTVKVSLSFPFELWTPIISQIVGDNTIVLTAEATQTIVSE